MTANEPLSMNFFFPALIAAMILILVLLRRLILTQQATTEVLGDAHRKILQLTHQQEQWLESIQRTQEKLVMTFLALEEIKQHIGILPADEGNPPHPPQEVTNNRLLSPLPERPNHTRNTS